MLAFALCILSYRSESMDDAIRETQWKKKSFGERWITGTAVVIEHVILLFIIQLLSICMRNVERRGMRTRASTTKWIECDRDSFVKSTRIHCCVYRKTQLTWSVSDRNERKKKMANGYNAETFPFTSWRNTVCSAKWDGCVGFAGSAHSARFCSKQFNNWQRTKEEEKTVQKECNRNKTRPKRARSLMPVAHVLEIVPFGWWMKWCRR